MKRTLRRWHRIVSVIIALPVALIIVTGLVLQLRGQFEFIQPKAVKSTDTGAPLLSLEEISKRAGGPIDQIVFKPSKHSLTVRLADGNEVHLHPQTGAELKRGPRLTGFLIDLHQGSFLGPWSQYGLFVIAAWGLFFLLISGLLIYPWKKKV